MGNVSFSQFYLQAYTDEFLVKKKKRGGRGNNNLWKKENKIE